MLRLPVYALFLAGTLTTSLNSCRQIEPEKKALVKNQKAAELIREQFAGKIDKVGKQKLSEYGFFKGKISEIDPVDGVIPYDLNTPLFSDYALKARFIKFPANEKISYKENEVLDLPIGTFLIKTFYYPEDIRKPKGKRRLIETRIMEHKDDLWTTLAYIWNEEQTEAYLEIAGKNTQVSFINKKGEKITFDYSVPTQVQCKSCHIKNNKISPIGPSAGQLNKNFEYAHVTENQLTHWKKAGIMSSLPDISEIPQLPVWNDKSTGSLHERAMAYLDINCGHCHRPEGSGNTSGLTLLHHETEPYKIGIMKKPVAAGKGTGGRPYDIVPGKPDQSILLYRMESTDPGEMMPEVGRKLVHKEGVELIKAWIDKLK
jgi:uncharacterized repeat protein (TIGR03806 family)